MLRIQFLGLDQSRLQSTGIDRQKLQPSRHTGGDRGVKQAGFMVLTTARRPAILVEMGYSTNPRDGRLLTLHSSQRALASAIADAVVAYLLEYERKTGP